MIKFLLPLLFLTSCCRDAYNPFFNTPRNYQCPYDPIVPFETPIPDCALLTSCEAYQEIDACKGVTLSLFEVINLALVNSQKMRITFAETKVSASLYGQSIAPLYPQIDANQYYQAIKNGTSFGQAFPFPDQYMDWGTYASLNWLLFDCGATCANIETFRQRMLASNFSHNREIQSILDTTFTDYYNVIEAKEEVRASIANLKDAETILSATKLKHNLGIADLVDELQAETQVAKRSLDLLISEERLIDDKIQLVKDLGVPANTPLDFKEPPNQVNLEQQLPHLNYFVQEGYRFRPDLFAAFSDVCASVSNVTYQNRNQWFQLNFQGTGGYTSFKVGHLQPSSPVYNAIFTLSLPLFAGFDYLNKIRQAKAELCIAKAKMRQLELDMISEITTSYENLKLATEKVSVSLDYVNFAENAYKASLNRYEAGVIDFQTLINALTNLADARYSLAQSKRDWYVSVTELAFSTGTLVKPGCVQ